MGEPIYYQYKRFLDGPREVSVTLPVDLTEEELAEVIRWIRDEAEARRLFEQTRREKGSKR